MFRIIVTFRACQRFRQLGNRLIEVRDQSVIGDLENRRVLILVDGDDHLGILHAGEMLDRAGDADGDIEFRRHHLAGLPDLPVVRRIAGIHRRARGANAGAELVGQRLDVFGEILAALHGAAAGDDDFCGCQFRTVAFCNLLTDKGLERPGSSADAAFSTEALPPSPAAAKVEVRTVMTFLASFDFTVWIALPA